MNRLFARMVAGAMVLSVSAAVLGQGMLVPADRTLPPLSIKSQQVEIAIDNQVATTTIKQVFTNSTSRALEANYVFPLPADATIRDFAMMIDGKRVAGEVVEAGKAKQIYQQIVAQARDPGLLEHLGNNLFRVNIFPVPANGNQSTEITYSQVVRGSNGLFRYTYPLHTADKASAVQDFFSIGAKLTSKTALKTVYSPTHDIGVSRKGEHEATVGLEQSKVFLDKDFSLYWTISDKDFGLNAAAYRPKPDEPGYLMLLLSPKSAVNEEEVVAKDVIFVFDTSGSMQGGKIEQARKALTFCVEALNAKDRFAVVAFSTDLNAYKDELIDATRANKQAAREFINKLTADGGTNIHDALAKALAIAKLPPPQGEGRGEGAAASDSARPRVVVFLTDGRPTIGKTGMDDILGVLGGQPQTRAGAARIFTFGVGDDVNTKLLDQVANKTGGQPEYVRPKEDIEVKVSDFFAKASHPVLTGLTLAFGGDVKVDQMLPGALPDLYFGQQVIAFARYTGSGDVSVTLRGTVSDGKTEKNTYEVSLPKQTTDNNFIEPLWAHRKVGYLLDQIRIHGEDKELKDEVIRLSTAYKIQTPYTSYLVLENRDRARYRPGVAKQDGSGGADPLPPSISRPAGGPSAPDATATGQPASGGRYGEYARERADAVARVLSTSDKDKLRDEERRSLERVAKGIADGDSRQTWNSRSNEARWGRGVPASQPGGMGYTAADLQRETGETAVNIAGDIARMKNADTTRAAGPSAVKQAAGRAFYSLNGFWIDEKFAAPIKMTFVTWGSEAYFAIVSAHVELKDVFALGTRLIVVTADGRALVISDNDGDEKIGEKELAELFAPAAKAK